MKIGIMLRHYEQHGGGVKVYTDNLLKELSRMDTPHEFVFIYENPKLVGTYSDGKRIREIAVNSPTRLQWDQFALPRIEKKEKFDLIFNPKYSIPLSTKCKTVWVCHGLPWYVMPWASKFVDRISHRFLIPLYVKKADAIIAVSEATRKHFIEVFKIEPDRVHTVYLGLSDVFKKNIESSNLQAIRKRYKLPQKFFLYVGQIYPPKNFGRILEAFHKIELEMDIGLVVAGKDLKILRGRDREVINSLGKNARIVWAGWVNHDELPGVYALAEALIMPSLYEGFGIPTLEAMACGCPVVTANRSGTKDVAGSAAVLVDPENTNNIANGMRQIVLNQKLREHCIKAGLKRSAEFSWKKCAMETIRVLESVVKLTK